MQQSSTVFDVETPGSSMILVTSRISDWVQTHEPTQGLLTLLCQHTSASLTIQENASPEVRGDLDLAFDRLAPRTLPYAHSLEGPDDMPAHIRTVLSGAQLSIPVIDGRLALGTWQGIFLWEHRDAPHHRRIAAHLLYE
ncbi:MAG: secondary thiamine-phosphate synthase enzyme YjbQ [Pseudomonadota bacterium]